MGRVLFPSLVICEMTEELARETRHFNIYIEKSKVKVRQVLALAFLVVILL